MGKLKRTFNRKARQSDDTKSSKAKDRQDIVEGNNDVYKNTADNDSNLLAIDSKKEKIKKHTSTGTGKTKKPLSKKQRKRLQQIVDQKRKKERVC